MIKHKNIQIDMHIIIFLKMCEMSTRQIKWFNLIYLLTFQLNA